MKTETPNYSDAQLDLIEKFQGTGTNGALTLADATTLASNPAMNTADGEARKPRSIVAKINRMGLAYEKKVQTRKDGSAVESKAALVEQIAKAVGVTFDALGNAGRADLVKLRDFAVNA